ncbi:MAG TPA: DUF1648 domain-containing protein, partial [Trueperaceae bacterium]|nr:DUF1648 domain-containing protein [Trueperaceae bacterium]
MTTAPTTGSRTHREAEQHVRRMHLLVAGGVTAAATLVYLWVLFASRGRLPTTMATHFGLSGRADDFMATATALVVQGATVLGVPLMLLLVLASGQWWKGAGARPMTALVSGVGAGLTTLFAAITRAHVGIEDPTGVSLTWQTGVLALGVGAVVAIAAAFVLPRALPRPPTPPVEPLKIAPNDSVSWFGRAGSSTWLLGVLALAAVVL